MTDNEFILFDRLTKIKSVMKQYGEDNFFISFSGGKDSTVLSALVDMAIPGNNIPRVYADTGIELNMIRQFVMDLAKTDKRIQIIKPTKSIKKTLETEGYPFKSKMHSDFVRKYQESGTELKSVRAYMELEPTLSGRPIKHPCPKKLKYQFTDENTLKISDRCCLRMKEEPLKKWGVENNKKYGMVGIMRDEEGRRHNAQCLVIKAGKLKNFQPLAPITKEWEQWFIDTYNIKICDIYKPPYNFVRTGCKGCPFAIQLKEELEVLEKYFPNERKQCEIIWKPVYDEYRRLNYRLKKGD